MGTTPASLLYRNSVFAWIAVATCCLLLIPLVAMRFTPEVRWDLTDFLVMGLLLGAAGSGFVLAARRAPRQYRVALGVVVAGVFFWAWAELSVGVFTKLGS